MAETISKQVIEDYEQPRFTQRETILENGPVKKDVRNCARMHTI